MKTKWAKILFIIPVKLICFAHLANLFTSLTFIKLIGYIIYIHNNNGRRINRTFDKVVRFSMCVQRCASRARWLRTAHASHMYVSTQRHPFPRKFAEKGPPPSSKTYINGIFKKKKKKIASAAWIDGGAGRGQRHSTVAPSCRNHPRNETNVCWNGE